jgi:hypothetical protein
MGNCFSVTAPVQYTSARNITSYISGISSAATAIPTISTILITYPVHAKNFRPTATPELSRPLLSNDLLTIQTTRCTVNYYAEGSDGVLKRSGEREREEASNGWMQVNRAGRSGQDAHASTKAIWNSPKFPATQEDVLTGSLKSATTSHSSRKLEEREVYTSSHPATTVQVSPQAEPLLLTGATSEKENDQFTSFNPGTPLSPSLKDTQQKIYTEKKLASGSGVLRWSPLDNKFLSLRCRMVRPFRRILVRTVRYCRGNQDHRYP